MTNRKGKSAETVSVLVAEQGAEWLGWARKLREGANALIVLIQGNSEDPDSFAERVSKRITRLHKSGTTIERAAFVAREAEPRQVFSLQAQRRVGVSVERTEEQPLATYDRRVPPAGEEPIEHGFLLSSVQRHERTSRLSRSARKEGASGLRYDGGGGFGWERVLHDARARHPHSW